MGVQFYNCRVDAERVRAGSRSWWVGLERGRHGLAHARRPRLSKRLGGPEHGQEQAAQGAGLTQARPHTRARACMRTCMDVHTHAYTHMRTHTRMHMRPLPRLTAAGGVQCPVIVAVEGPRERAIRGGAQGPGGTPGCRRLHRKWRVTDASETPSMQHHETRMQAGKAGPALGARSERTLSFAAGRLPGGRNGADSNAHVTMPRPHHRAVLRHEALQGHGRADLSPGGAEVLGRAEGAARGIDCSDGVPRAPPQCARARGRRARLAFVPVEDAVACKMACRVLVKSLQVSRRARRRPAGSHRVQSGHDGVGIGLGACGEVGELAR